MKEAGISEKMYFCQSWGMTVAVKNKVEWDTGLEGGVGVVVGEGVGGGGGGCHSPLWALSAESHWWWQG